MVSLKDTIANAIVYGTRRRAAGILQDRHVPAMTTGSGAVKRKRAHRKSGGAESYMTFVKQWQRLHPQYSWAEAVKLARNDYHTMGMGVMAAGLGRSSASGVVGGARKKKAARHRKRRAVL